MSILDDKIWLSGKIGKRSVYEKCNFSLSADSYVLM